MFTEPLGGWGRKVLYRDLVERFFLAMTLQI
jgi:hypothetical protein